MVQVKKLKALTGERSQYLVHDFNDVTVRFVLGYGGAVDAEILRNAVKAVLYSVDVLHGAFLVEKNRPYWRIYEEIPEELFFRHIRTDTDPMEMACQQAMIPVKPGEPVKLRCTLVECGERCAVVLCVSHTVADGGDARYLLGKVVDAYNRILETGTAEGLAVKNGSRSPEQLYANLSKKDQRKLWKNPMPGTKNVFPFVDQGPGIPRMVRRVIPRRVMERSRERAKQDALTANDLILAACYQAFAEADGVDRTKPISITAMMDLRKHCPGGDSEGLSNMAGSLKTVLWDGVTGSFCETLAEIGRQTRLAKEDPMSGLEGVPMMHHAVGHGPMGLLRKAAPIVYGNMSMGVTNLGNLNSREYMLGALAPVSGLMGGPSKKKPGVQVSVLSVDGECALSIAGEYSDADARQLESMLDEIVKVIRDYAHM